MDTKTCIIIGILFTLFLIGTIIYYKKSKNEKIIIPFAYTLGILVFLFTTVSIYYATDPIELNNNGNQLSYFFLTLSFLTFPFCMYYTIKAFLKKYIY